MLEWCWWSTERMRKSNYLMLLCGRWVICLSGWSVLLTATGCFITRASFRIVHFLCLALHLSGQLSTIVAFVIRSLCYIYRHSGKWHTQTHREFTWSAGSGGGGWTVQRVAQAPTTRREVSRQRTECEWNAREKGTERSRQLFALSAHRVVRSHEWESRQQLSMMQAGSSERVFFTLSRRCIHSVVKNFQSTHLLSKINLSLPAPLRIIFILDRIVPLRESFYSFSLLLL